MIDPNKDGVMTNEEFVYMINMNFKWLEANSDYFGSKGCVNPMIEARYLNSLLDGVNMNYLIDPASIPLDAIKQKVLQQYAPYYNSQ